MLDEYKNRCIDTYALLSFYMNQMEYYPRPNDELNNLTDAMCVYIQIQNQVEINRVSSDLAMASFAMYILNNKAQMIDAIMEYHGKDELDFNPKARAN